MKSSEAKNLQIIDLLSNVGFNPAFVKGGSAWFKSPLRNERTASFKVNLVKNCWYDFGEGIGGNIFALVMRIYKVDFKEALHIIGNEKIHLPYFGQYPKDLVIPSGKIEINYTQELSSPTLLKNFSLRRVNLAIAKKHVLQAYYSIHGKQYYAIAFKNDKGGYELRNERFKGGSSPKHHTTVHGNSSTGVNIFEGFFDFLSFLTWYNRPRPKYTSVILNSLSFLDKIIHGLSEYHKINLFLDNDQAGQKATARVKEVRPDAIDCSTIIYPDSKDFNDFLMKSKIRPFFKDGMKL
jgi:hypothetical protein